MKKTAIFLLVVLCTPNASARTEEAVPVAMQAYKACGLDQVGRLPGLSPQEAAQAAVDNCEPQFKQLESVILEFFRTAARHNPRLDAQIVADSLARAAALKEKLYEFCLQEASKREPAQTPYGIPTVSTIKKRSASIEIERGPKDEIYFIFDGDIDQESVSTAKQKLSALAKNQVATVLLNSAGGSLSSGLELGRAFRTEGMKTKVGRLSGGRLTPGECYSSCVFALAGGYFRLMEPESKIGVHRFYKDSASSYDLELAQVMSGEIISFLREMGVDPKLFELMASTSGRDILVLSDSELRKLNLLNYGELSAEWALQTTQNGIVYLQGQQETEAGLGKISFVCTAKGIGAVGAYLGPTEIPPEVEAVGLRINGSLVGELRLSRPVVVGAGGQLLVDFVPTQEELNLMLGAGKIGFSFKLPNQDQGFVFDIDATKGMKMLSNFLKACAAQSE